MRKRVIETQEKHEMASKNNRVKRFKEAEIHQLLNKLTKEEISFSRFVEILNEPKS